MESRESNGESRESGGGLEDTDGGVGLDSFSGGGEGVGSNFSFLEGISSSPSLSSEGAGRFATGMQLEKDSKQKQHLRKGII